MFAWNRCERKFGPLVAQRQTGALSAADAVALERHLRDCTRCNAWEAEMRELAAGLRLAGDTLTHPAPEELAALSTGGQGLTRQDAEAIERHLENCADCHGEWNVATRFRPPEAAAPADRAWPVRWGSFAAGALSAAAAVVALVALVLPRGAAPATAARPAIEPAAPAVHVRGAHHRAAREATVVVVPASAGVVLVGLTVEAAPGSTLEVELRDESGGALDRAELTLDDPSGLLTFSVAASRLPRGAGEFHVRVAGTDESFRYPFQVERSDD
jgi:hypothetical protein